MAVDASSQSSVLKLLFAIADSRQKSSLSNVEDEVEACPEQELHYRRPINESVLISQR